MEEKLELLGIAKGLDFSKVMGFTMVEETFENYMHLNFEQY
jgi:hypothetical protein